jgi:organic hydroperoxide reductase OsmC/OhrA
VSGPRLRGFATIQAVAAGAKQLRYAVKLTPSDKLMDETGAFLEVPPEWSPEHLLLAALVRCTLKSLRYHARRTGVEVRSASGRGRTLVTKRVEDDRYAMVETEVELTLGLEPEPEREELPGLLALAERDCFVGSSLTATPSYRWTVNGRTIDS